MELKLISKSLKLSELDLAYDPQRIQSYCENCPNFAQNWSCPPLSFSAPELFSARDRIFLTACKIEFSEAERMVWRGQKIDYFNLNFLSELKRNALQAMRALEPVLPGSLALAFGACDYCKVCSRPTKPCRKPELMRYSLEALGYDLSFLSEYYLDLPLLWAQNELPEYFALLGALVYSTDALAKWTEARILDLFKSQLEPCVSELT
ncbi:MAG: DUF2284 domain-containing protein [Eubacteriales bacterium]|nr:DUF2284 domain-containing protein [Eubacteriales bacterium]